MHNAKRILIKRVAVVIVLTWGVFEVWNYSGVAKRLKKQIVLPENFDAQLQAKEMKITESVKSASHRYIKGFVHPSNTTQGKPEIHNTTDVTLKNNNNSKTSNINSNNNSRNNSNSNKNNNNKNNTYEHLLNPGFPLEGLTKHPKPDFMLGKLQDNSDMIIGIPTVKRAKGDYLMDTITSLLRNRKSKTANVKVLVCIGETNKTFLNERSNHIFQAFENEVQQGDLQIIAPPQNYYPNWNTSITNSLGDPLDRVKWRSKQNIDQVFMMAYVYHLSPKYYLMLEDDVLTKEGFDEIILKEAKSRENQEWFYISFSQLGAIGKLFRITTLPSLASFIHMFWNKQPLDWLLDDYVRTSNCGHGAWDRCVERMHAKMLYVTPSLFQHMGTFSSLKGKLMPVKDKKFK